MSHIEIKIDYSIHLSCDETNHMLSFLVQQTFTQIQLLQEPVLCKILGMDYEIINDTLLSISVDKTDLKNLRVIYHNYKRHFREFLYTPTIRIKRFQYNSLLRNIASRIRYTGIRGLKLLFKLS